MAVSRKTPKHSIDPPPQWCRCGEETKLLQITVLDRRTGHYRRGTFSEFGVVQRRGGKTKYMLPNYLKFRLWHARCWQCEPSPAPQAELAL
ncbi:MAG: hypothetical protein AAGI44_03030 [Pseudomonadota bacterium]